MSHALEKMKKMNINQFRANNILLISQLQWRVGFIFECQQNKNTFLIEMMGPLTGFICEPLGIYVCLFCEW